MQGPTVRVTRRNPIRRRRGKLAPPAPGGNIVEIFSGIQGEGLYVGRRQIFLRLAGCNLRCDYCDQPEARTVPPAARIERTPGRRDFAAVANPVSPDQAARAVLRLHRPKGLHQALALTGGEPLLQADFLAAVLSRQGGIRESVPGILLETNGTRCDELRGLLPLIDIVSMDFKLRSSTGRPAPVAAHGQFLRLAVRHAAAAYVKAVVTARTTTREITRAAKVIAGVKRSVSLVLQPVTPRVRGAFEPPTPAQLLALQGAAARHLDDVRVIPQTHRIIGQL